ncbi:prepilin-type N-terminal cleavage/methylation domain-containing protein [Persephonella atlantica]|uniref:Prepilin-type N-terminal cleavage/methylation domain-containing protein n=1 Tax=Persephonella atlantica TaxID=2699429 RepID=A0ABS1GFB6_9AQUI|nr:prepilin-type N-terminal cleavage/methylation domain-containing protein [Persephonella atlantica]MBK3331621.1 prepilin-type N-terminal cleavage/methylation domain-containing protein [Persephonella atlantica]
MNRKGFTLIELAMVLVIIGLLAGIGITALGILVKRAKVNSTKEIVNADVEAVLGYTFSIGKIPDLSTFLTVVRNKKDSFGKDIVYIYDSGLTSYCGRLKTNITVYICSDAACTVPVQTIRNVAFIILSGSANYNNQTAGAGEITTPTVIKVYDYGIKVDDYSGDLNRVEPYDDIVKWVTLSELHNNEKCKPLYIDPNQNLPEAIEDAPYRAKIDVSGGVPPYQFGTWNGSSCDTTSLWNGYGLSLTTDGYITGTVNYDTDSNKGSITGCEGNITISNICVKDSLGDEITIADNLNIKVFPQQVKILTDTVPPAYEGSSYNITFFVSGGGDSYTWNIQGSLPPDLTFSNGQITGTVQSDSGCSTPSPYNFTLEASSCGMTAFKGYVLTVIDPDCNSSGGGSGGSGSCSSVTVFNAGDIRYYEKGTVFLFWCIASTRCTEFTSATVSNGECITVYRDFRCRRIESSYGFNTLVNYDTNNNCEVNYNNGRLSDR